MLPIPPFQFSSLGRLHDGSFECFAKQLLPICSANGCWKMLVLVMSPIDVDWNAVDPDGSRKFLVLVVLVVLPMVAGRVFICS